MSVLQIIGIIIATLIIGFGALVVWAVLFVARMVEQVGEGE